MTEFDDESKRVILKTLAQWWLDKARYPAEIASLCPHLVNASLRVFNTTLKALLPTPTRSHYTFNLRDLTGVFQGMQTAGATLRSADGAVRLWIHEVMRVFSDRLVDEADRAWFTATVRIACEENLGVSWCASCALCWLAG